MQDETGDKTHLFPSTTVFSGCERKLAWFMDEQKSKVWIDCWNDILFKIASWFQYQILSQVELMMAFGMIMWLDLESTFAPISMYFTRGKVKWTNCREPSDECVNKYNEIIKGLSPQNSYQQHKKTDITIPVPYHAESWHKNKSKWSDAGEGQIDLSFDSPRCNWQLIDEEFLEAKGSDDGEVMWYYHTYKTT